MASLFTIGHVAKRTGLAASAIRYYERLGLISPTGRTESSYRLYDDSSIEQLRFVTEAHSAGFTLEDIKALLCFRDGSRTACNKVKIIISRRLADVEQQMDDLKGVETILHKYLEACEQVVQGGECPVLVDLASSSGHPSAKNNRTGRVRSERR